MSRPRNDAANSATETNIKRPVSRLFSRRPSENSCPPTHETIAEDLATFLCEGGTVEALGETLRKPSQSN
jgi:hypothetical protein